MWGTTAGRTGDTTWGMLPAVDDITPEFKVASHKFMPQSIKCIIIVIVIVVVVVVVDDDKPWTVYLILFSHLMF